MVEYIIILAIIAVIMTFLFPGLRTAMQDWMGNIEEGMDAGMTGETVNQGFEIGSAMPVLFGIIFGIMTIGMIFAVISSAGSSDTEEKVELPEEKVEPIKEVVEEKKPRTWDEIWNDVKGHQLLPYSYIEHIENILTQTTILLPQVQERNWTEESHVILRIKDVEVQQLVEKYLNLNDKQKVKQEKKFEKALVHIESELNDIQKLIDKNQQDEFTQTVRVIETRYEE